MKRLSTALLFLILLTFSVSPSFAVGQFTQQPYEHPGKNQDLISIRVGFWADASDGSFPVGTINAANMTAITGKHLAMIRTNPDNGTAPTDNYDIVVQVAGVDLLDGNGANRDTANTEVAYPSSITKPIDGTVTITLTNNSVNSAAIVMDLYFVTNPVGVPGATPGTTDVDVVANTIGLATSAKQDTIIASLAGGLASEAKQDDIIADTGAIQTSVEIMDDWDESDRAKVNPIVGQAGVAAGAGAVDATVQRTTLASDDPAVVSLQIMDDWDDSDYLNSNINVAGTDVTAGAGAVAAGTPRVTLASDDPAVVDLAAMEVLDTTRNTLLNGGLPAALAADGGLKVSPVTADAAEGAAPTNPPVPIAGVDGSANVKIPVLDSNGYLQVDVVSDASSADLISTNNSTTTPLGDGATFTGTGDDAFGYATVVITLDASHDSATDGMQFHFSTDNTNWDDIYSFTYTAANGARRFQFPITARYFRVQFQNSAGAAQTHLRIQTILHTHNTLTSIHRLVDNMSPDRSAQVTKTAIFGQAAGSGDFIPVDLTASGNLKVSMQEISDGLDVGAGNAGSETQRVSISTDDVNLSAIKTAIELLDNAVNGSAFAVTQEQGATPYGFISTASANMTNVKASAGTLYSLTVINPTASVQYFRLYNKASAPDTSACSGNSDCPILEFPIPTQGDTNGAGVTIPIGTLGWYFSTGIGYSINGAACTVLTTCTDETAALAGVTIALGYK